MPTVKLVRQTRRHHRGDQKPGGLYFEILTYWAFQSGAITGDSFAEIFAQTLRAVATQLATGEPATDPVLGRPYKPAPEPDDLATARRSSTSLRPRRRRRCARTSARRRRSGARSSARTAAAGSSGCRRAATSRGTRCAWPARWRRTGRARRAPSLDRRARRRVARAVPARARRGGLRAGRRRPALWVGPIADSLRRAHKGETMKIVFFDGWPFQHPRLFVEGLDEQHVSARGEVCLWATGAPPEEWPTFSDLPGEDRRVGRARAPPASGPRTSRSTRTVTSAASGPARSRPSTSRACGSAGGRRPRRDLGHLEAGRPGARDQARAQGRDRRALVLRRQGQGAAAEPGRRPRAARRRPAEELRPSLQAGRRTWQGAAVHARLGARARSRGARTAGGEERRTRWSRRRSRSRRRTCRS